MATILTSEGIKFPDGTVQTSGLPVGAILLWNSSIGSIPTGWALCDGNNGTPNLTDKFIIGAGSTYSIGDIGGSSTSGVGEHTHTAPPTTGEDGDHFHVFTNPHTHTTTGPTVSSNAGAHNHLNNSVPESEALLSAGPHTHNYSFTTDAAGAHGHPISTNSANSHDHDPSTTNPTSWVHRHVQGYGLYAQDTNPSFPLFDAGAAPTAQHPMCYYTAYDPSPTGFPLLTGGVNPPGQVPVESQFYGALTSPDLSGIFSPSSHTHSATMGPSGDHTHTLTMPSPGGTHRHDDPWPFTTPSGGSHTHPIVSSSVEPDGNHTHSLDVEDVILTVSENGEHSHPITVDPAGSSSSDTNLPPYYSLAFIIKTS